MVKYIILGLGFIIDSIIVGIWYIFYFIVLGIKKCWEGLKWVEKRV